MGLALLVLSACRSTNTTAPVATKFTCGDGAPMKVHFYDVGQGLAALVELPTGQLVLVDAGESPTRAGCGKVCAGWNDRFLEQLSRDVAGRTISLLWITHPHSDHIGGAASVMQSNEVAVYADNGQGRSSSTVKKTLEAATERGVRIAEASTSLPESLLGHVDGLSVRGVLPPSLSDCKNPNDCSAGLRIDYCSSSVLFVGDAENREESVLDISGQATLLQVGHHGSETSSSEAFVAKVNPRYAVISAAVQGEGTNRTFCHPRAGAIRRLSAALGDESGPPITAFSGASCSKGGDEEWRAVPSSSRLFVTSRDGDVTLTTTGDGSFRREIRAGQVAKAGGPLLTSVPSEPEENVQ
jgi:competence protein ComEC